MKSIKHISLTLLAVATHAFSMGAEVTPAPDSPRAQTRKKLLKVESAFKEMFNLPGDLHKNYQTKIVPLKPTLQEACLETTKHCDKECLILVGTISVFNTTCLKMLETHKSLSIDLLMQSLGSQSIFEKKEGKR